MNPNQLHDDLRECWELVSVRPGLSLRAIACEIGITVYRARQLVDLLLESGTFVKASGKNPEQLHDDLRECWELVTAQPGISLRNIVQEMGIKLWRARQLVDLLLESGTFVRAPGKKSGTLRVTVPLVPLDNTTTKNRQQGEMEGDSWKR